MSTQLVAEGGRLRVSGPVTLVNAAVLATDAEQYLSGEVVVDLAAVTEVDSSALSLLFEWQRVAQRRQCKLSFCNLPASLASLAELYGVTDLIPAGA
jgi:phospholipid transport system transporter-binding protein